MRGKRIMKILIDLERSIASGMIYYWNQNKHGYTRDINEAGIFSEAAAEAIVNDDFDKRTIAINTEVVERILKGD
jgi:hypothetical protein